MSADLAQSGGAQCYLVLGTREPALGRRDQKLALESLTSEGVHAPAVDTDVFAPRDGRSGDGTIAFEDGGELAELDWAVGRRGEEGQVERLAVQGGSAGQMGEAGAEHRGCA
jgi:hypothetical protein